MTCKSRSTISEILNSLEKFGEVHARLKYKKLNIPSNVKLYYKNPDLVDLLFVILSLSHPNLEEIMEKSQRRYFVERLIDDVVLAKMEAAFYGDHTGATVVANYFSIYNKTEDEARFWHNMKRFQTSYPNPYTRLKTILFILLAEGDIWTFGMSQ